MNEAEILELSFSKFDHTANKLANVLLEEEKKSYRTDVQPFEVHEAETKAQFHNSCNKFKQSFVQGYQTVLDCAAKGETKFSQKDFKLDWSGLPDGEKITKKILLQILQETRSLQQIYGYTGEMMTSIYEIGVKLYQKKDFDQCINIFTFLITLNPYVCWFWQMLGKAYQALKKYVEALGIFEVAIKCNLYGIESYQDAVKCCFAENNFQGALRILDYGFDAIRVSANPESLANFKNGLQTLKNYVIQMKPGR